MSPAQPIVLPADTIELRKQIRKLQDLGYNVRRCSPHHLKIGAVNYFPSTGVITTDPKHRQSAKGFDALLKVLQRIASQTPIISLEDES